MERLQEYLATRLGHTGAVWVKDEYETRTPYQVRCRLWASWHHHVALCLLARPSC